MLAISQDSRQCLLTWDDWRLQFEWRDDRWTHSLLHLPAESLVPPFIAVSQLVAVEGTTLQAWPQSPAFQDLLTERISSDCIEVQLLGQAGKNHYSGAIRCDAAQNLIDFDLAVRIQTLPVAPLTLTTYQHSQLERGSGFPVWHVEPLIIPGFPSCACRLESTNETNTLIRLSLDDLSSMKFDRHRATIRWKYQLRLQT